MRSTPRPEQAKDAKDAGRQLRTDVLFTLDEAGLKRLRKNIAKDFAEQAAAITHMKTPSLQ